MVEVNQKLTGEKLTTAIGPTKPIGQLTEPRTEGPFNSGVSEEHQQLVKNYDNVLRVDPDATLILDPTGKAIYGNDSYFNHLPIDCRSVIRDNIERTPIYPTIWGEHLTVPEAIRAGMIKNYTSEQFTFQEYGISYQAFVLPIQGLGSETNVRIILRDITELADLKAQIQALEENNRILEEEKRASEEARQLSDAIRQNEKRSIDFRLGIIAHDFKTPMTIIKGYAQLANRIANSPEPDLNQIKDGTNLIVANANSLIDTVNDQIAGLKLSPDLREKIVSFTSILETACRTHTILAEQKNIKAETHLYDQPLDVVGDDRALSSVLDILITNAIQAMEELEEGKERKLSIFSELSGDDGEAGNIIVTVKDTGIGIPEERWKKLFSGLSTKLNTDQKGSGLGLARARELVRLHGGNLGLANSVTEEMLQRNSKLGHIGSIFTFTLPLFTPAKQNS